MRVVYVKNLRILCAVFFLCTLNVSQLSYQNYILGGDEFVIDMEVCHWRRRIPVTLHRTNALNVCRAFGTSGMSVCEDARSRTL